MILKLVQSFGAAYSDIIAAIIKPLIDGSSG